MSHPTYYAGHPETGKPLDDERFAEIDECHDHIEETYGAGAVNDTHVVMEEQPRCECGEAGADAPCDGAQETTIEYVEPSERGTADKLGSWAGLSVRLEVSADCADAILEHQGRWAREV